MSAMPTTVRNAAAVALAATSGATDAIGYLALGHVFTSAMTGNLVLLGISLGHRNGERAGRVLLSVACFVVGCAIGARTAGDPEPNDPVWPSAATRALLVETGMFVLSAVVWWASDARPGFAFRTGLLGVGALALGVQSSMMQRFGVQGLNTTFLSGALMRFVGRLATGHRFRDVHHHLLLLAGLVTGGALAALAVLHAPVFAPLVQLVPLAFALAAAAWQRRAGRRAEETGVSHAVPTA